MKRILYLRSDYSDVPLYGGSMVHMTGVINALARRDVIVTAALPFPFKHLSFDASVKLIRLKRPPIFPRFLWRITCFLGSLWYPWQLRKVIQKEAFDYIYYRYAFMDLTAVVLKWIFNIPIIMEYNGSEAWIDKELRPKGEIKFGWLASFVERINLKSADHIIVVSDVLKDELLQVGIDGCKILMNPNGVDTDEFDPKNCEDMRNKMRRNLNIEGKFVFCFVGSFSRWHGINILERMVPEVVRENKRAHFLFIGDGEFRQNLERTMADRGLCGSVTFTGNVTYPNVRAYIAASDVCLLPAQSDVRKKYYCSPIKLFEYMSMEKPVIVSNLEQIAQVVDGPQPCGFVVRYDMADEFVKAARALSDVAFSDYVQMGKSARNRVVNGYTWIGHVGRIIDFVQRN
ncbi:glycosyltransferase family 4 protein [Candidatus Babeliales bacterium]|nr:glycosyltransferase family 4 protein [Candidatus Babeliales bacterium]